MAHIVADARNIARSFEQLPGQQSHPQGEHIIVKVVVPKVPPYHYQKSVRDAAVRKAFEETILPAFHRKDKEKRGRSSFTLLLTWSEN
jgi:hypothetical protein